MDFLHQPIFWAFAGGLFLGLIGVAFLAFRFADAKTEVRHLRQHMTDRLAFESEATNGLRRDLQELKGLNENLRIKIAMLNQEPERRLQRELEIFARAERWMVSSSPGFPAIWEQAKRSAISDLEQEEQGRSFPQRVFNALLNRSSSGTSAPAVPSRPQNDSLRDAQGT